MRKKSEQYSSYLYSKKLRLNIQLKNTGNTNSRVSGKEMKKTMKCNIFRSKQNTTRLLIGLTVRQETVL